MGTAAVYLQWLYLVERHFLPQARLVQLRHHKVVERLEIPRRHERPKDPSENTHEATEGRQEIQRGVSRPMIVYPIQVDFDRDADPAAVFFLKR